MTTDSLVGFTMHALLLCLSISLPPVIAAALTGLAISFFQAITSLQDQALPHAIKLAVVVITLMIVAPACCSALLGFATQMLQQAVPQ